MNFLFAILPGFRAAPFRTRRQVAQYSRSACTSHSQMPRVCEDTGTARGLNAVWRINPVTGRLELRWFLDDEIDGSSVRHFFKLIAMAVAIPWPRRKVRLAVLRAPVVSHRA